LILVELGLANPFGIGRQLALQLILSPLVADDPRHLHIAASQILRTRDHGQLLACLYRVAFPHVDFDDLPSPLK
jgi:hypothetical protein